MSPDSGDDHRLVLGGKAVSATNMVNTVFETFQIGSDRKEPTGEVFDVSCYSGQGCKIRKENPNSEDSITYNGFVRQTIVSTSADNPCKMTYGMRLTELYLRLKAGIYMAEVDLNRNGEITYGEMVDYHNKTAKSWTKVYVGKRVGEEICGPVFGTIAYPVTRSLAELAMYRDTHPASTSRASADVRELVLVKKK
jgi:hypothetical protein